MTEPILELATDDGPAVAQALQGAPGVIEAAMFGRAVHVLVTSADEAATQLPAYLGDRKLSCRGLRRVSPSLEDVFVSLVRREGGAVVG